MSFIYAGQISDFGKNIRNHIDSNTLTINLPQQIADYNQLLEQEDTRSQDASKLRDQLRNEYKEKVGRHRTIRDFAATFFFLTLFSAPFVRKSMINMHQRRRSKAASPEPTEDP